MVGIKGLREELEQFFLPQLNRIEGELKAFRGEMIGELKAINTRIDATNSRIDSVEKEIKGIRENMDFVQRLAILEQKFADMKS